ncbi:MAG: hypothetical protein H8E44_13130 [Planctomycetes bacterium]|nr:hypothetical protein [Planctomycetota bacterium]MBL7040204.1 hypothetical protein [Pirellulaceae bacterium]
MFAATLLTAVLLPIADDASIDVSADGRVIPCDSRTTDDDPRRTVAGDLYVEPSTLHSLGFEWKIRGDENRNGCVSVQYREEGKREWKQGMDLLRIKGERVGRDAKSPRDNPTWEYVCGNLYAGSILFLEPGTKYEVRLTMTDLDHGSGGSVDEKRLIVATKSEPKVFANGRLLHVYPSEHEGEKIQPAYDDFLAAYEQVQPGDQILLHAGRYGGSYALNKSGTRDRPIVIRDAGDGPVVFQGNPDADNVTREPIKGTDDFHWHQNVSLFDVSSANYHWFRGLTIRNFDYGIHSGDGGTTRGLTVRYCRFEDCGWSGILIRSSACRDIYIADNVFRGTQGTWFRSEQKPFPYKGVWVNGQGVDVCYNLAQNHKDGISVFGKVADRSVFEKKAAAIDFYNNDVGQSWDDNEADAGQHNIRFFHNRLVDQHIGLSAQPIYGGPCYFIRNVQYNITRGVPFKTNVQPAGVLIYNNTSVCCGMIHGKGVASITPGFSNSRIFNNLFLGLNGPTLSSGFFDPEISQIDYNGYTVVGPIEWTVFDERWMPKRRLSFPTFGEFAESTGFERHAVAVGFEDLVNVPKPPCESKTHKDLNFGDARPKAISRAVDAGTVIPNVTDGFTGKAPDLGAYELGPPMPHYGPRG